jgi:hypothetical protein
MRLRHFPVAAAIMKLGEKLILFGSVSLMSSKACCAVLSALSEGVWMVGDLAVQIFRLSCVSPSTLAAYTVDS